MKTIPMEFGNLKTIVRRSSKTVPSIMSEINLQKGWPHPSLLPTAQMLRASAAVLSNEKTAKLALQYGTGKGYQPLRTGIVSWLERYYVTPKNKNINRIGITGGASQGLVSISQQFADPRTTRVIWMVAPTYFLACRIFEDAGFEGRLRAVPEDDEGIDTAFLRRNLEEMNGSHGPIGSVPSPGKKYRHLIYNVPSFSNPSSRIMSLRRRESLVRIARDFDALIISDDVYDCLQWNTAATGVPSEKAVMPRLVDLDQELDGGTSRFGADSFGNTVSNGSFSKLLGPGCRTGWVEGTESFVESFAQVGSTISGGSASQLAAVCISNMVETGRLQEHIASVLVPSYASRYGMLRVAIERYLYPLGVSMVENESVFGGFFVWLKLPDNISADLVARNAKNEEKLLVTSGSLFEVSGDEDAARFQHNIRLSFAYEDAERLDEGVRRLGSIIYRLL